MSGRLDAIEQRCEGADRYRTYKTDDVRDLVAVARAAHAYLAAAQHGLNGSEDDDRLGQALRPLLEDAS